jgi:hypothetical protein
LPVDLVTGDPLSVHPGVQSTGDHLPGQFRLGREHQLLGHPGSPSPVGVGGPDLREVELPVDEGMPGIGGISQKHRDLAVLDSPGRAGVLALHPDRADALCGYGRCRAGAATPGFPERSPGEQVAASTEDVIGSLLPEGSGEGIAKLPVLVLELADTVGYGVQAA